MEDREFFKGGDIVTLRQDIPNKPVMLVDKIDRLKMSDSSSISLIGINTIWFDKNGAIHKHRFNFKDLEHVASK